MKVSRRYALLTACLLGAGGVMAHLFLAPARAAGVGVAKDKDAPAITTLITPIEDMEANVRVAQLDMKELEKIGRDFSTPYRIHNVVMHYKKPDKFRLSGQIPPFGEAVMIINGPTRFFKVPRLTKKTEDLTNAPGKRLSLLEYCGVVVPDTLRFMHSHFLREEKRDGQNTLVYEMTYIGPTSGLHYRLWIDPQTHITTKREWLDGDNKLRATFLYKDAHEVRPGVWLPSRLEVLNAEGVTAATSTLENVKIDQGISDDLFVIAP